MAKTKKAIVKPKLPKIFVGSSSEARTREIPQTFCSKLNEGTIPTPWWDAHEFVPMTSTLDALITAASDYDFGLFILTPDDEVKSRGKIGSSARDNVLFELGLFLGMLGRNRTFAVIEDAESEREKVKVLSDAAGIHIPRFRPGSDENELNASVNEAIRSIKRAIKSEGRMPIKKRLISELLESYDYYPNTKTFEMRLSSAGLNDNQLVLKNKMLVVVARKRDEDVNPEDDTRIAVGTPRHPSRMTRNDLLLRAIGEEVFKDVKAGDVMEGHLFVVPADFDPKSVRTMTEIGDLLCGRIGGGGITVS